MYENGENYKRCRRKMLSSKGRKKLLNLSIDLLSLDSGIYSEWGLSSSEIEWIEKSIDIVNRYNNYRVRCRCRNYHKTIDHGIAGALIMFDYMMSIAKDKRRETSGTIFRNPQEAKKIEPDEGIAFANRAHSRFRACCLMIALAVARHNVFVVQKTNDDVPLYKRYHLHDLIITDDYSKRITVDNPMDQLLYMLDFMDTIDPVKATYLRAVDGSAKDNPDVLELWKNYLLNDITIRCARRNEGWQDIEISFNNVDKEKEELINRFCYKSRELTDWLRTETPISVDNSLLNFFFPVIKRTGKPNRYNIEDEEIMDLCLYEGCGDSVRPGLFYQLPVAYQTFNLLMMDGLIGENVRIGEEKQCPNGVYIRDWRRTVKVFKNVFSAMCKYYTNLVNVDDIIMYRADRQVNSNMMRKHKRTIAFTSTSKADFLEGFAYGKKNLTYVKCRLSKRVPIADYAAILGDDYVYSDEAEILLPPWLAIEKIDNEKETDHPYEKDDMITTYSIVFGDMSFDNCSDNKEGLIRILDEYCEEAAGILDEFRKNPDLARTAVRDNYPHYAVWKKVFREFVNLELSEMWNKLVKDQMDSQ